MDQNSSKSGRKEVWKSALPILCTTQIALLAIALGWDYWKDLRIIEQFCLPRGGYITIAAAALAGWAISKLSNAYFNYRIQQGSVSFLWVRDALLGPIFSDMPIFWSSALSLLAAICEEFLFRGVILSAWGIAISSLLFGLMHGGHRHLRAYMVWAGLLGLIMGGLTLLSHSLWPAIALHCANNATSCRYLRQLRYPCLEA